MTTEARRMMARLMTEEQLLDAVIERAHQFGWLVHHSRAAMNARGRYSTPIQGDKGLPDLVMVHPVQCRTIFAELKTETGKVTGEQLIWLMALAGSGVEAYTWRPTHWHSGQIDAVLRGDGRQVQKRDALVARAS